MKLLLSVLLLTGFAEAQTFTGVMEVIHTDVTTSFGSVYVPGVPSQTTAETSGTITENGPFANINSTTTYTTTPGRPAQMVPIAENHASFRVIIGGQKLLLNCSAWHRCMTLEPGWFQISYSLKKNTWKDIWVYGNDTASGKAVKLKYHVVSEW